MSLPVGWTKAVPLDATGDGTIPASKLAEPPGLSVRRALNGGGNAGGTKSLALVSYAPTSGQFSGAINIGSGVAPVGICLVLGNGDAAGRFSLLIHPNGALEVRSGASTLALSPAGVFSYTGAAHHITWTVTPTSCALSCNGNVVVSTTFGAVTWITTNYNWQFGASSPTSGQRWPGDIWDVEFIDPASAANSATFALNGDFTNSRAGSEVTDATPTGLIQWATVLTTQGSARAVLAARPSYLAVRRGNGTNQVCDGSSASSFELVFQTTDVDELGGFTPIANRFTAPVPGVALIHVGGTFAGASVTDALSPIVQKGTSDELGRTWITASSGQNVSYALSVWVALAAGESVRLIVAGVDPSNTLLVHRNGFMAVDFRPTI